MARKHIDIVDLTAADKTAIAAWLRDRIAEVEPDAESVAEEFGKRFLPALRGLERHLRGAR